MSSTGLSPSQPRQAQPSSAGQSASVAGPVDSAPSANSVEHVDSAQPVNPAQPVNLGQPANSAPPVNLAQPARLLIRHILFGLAAVFVAAVVGVLVGPVAIAPHRGITELFNLLPLVDFDSGLSTIQSAIIAEIRAPRMVLGLLVGGMLAMSGAVFQGALRNPLADSYLLGVAAGAGVGATLAIISESGDGSGALDVVPLAAFAGALLAVTSAFVLGSVFRTPESGLTLILAGIAVASFFTAVQTYIQMREVESLRSIYSWLLGRLSTAGWGEVTLVAPYALACGLVMLVLSGPLDVLAVGDEEAASLGVHPRRIRVAALSVASLAAAAAVAVSGLIGFVGLVVPHAVRLVFGVSNRVVVPLSLLFGAAFLALMDVIARTANSPAELPIGVVTAFLGAPFFLYILHRHGRNVSA